VWLSTHVHTCSLFMTSPSRDLKMTWFGKSYEYATTFNMSTPSFPAIICVRLKAKEGLVRERKEERKVRERGVLRRKRSQVCRWAKRRRECVHW